MVWILGQHRDLFAHAEIFHTVMHDGAVVVWHREIGNTGGDFEVVPLTLYDSAHDDFDEVVSVCPALFVMKSDDVTELVRSRILASSSQRHLRF